MKAASRVFLLVTCDPKALNGLDGPGLWLNLINSTVHCYCSTASTSKTIRLAWSTSDVGTARLLLTASWTL